MSRITYDEYDDDGAELRAGRWLARERAVYRGKPAQRHFRLLRDALLAMPEHRLIEGQLCDENGGVCALGAMALHGITPEDAEQAFLDMRIVEPCEEGVAAWAQDRFGSGMSGTLAWLIQEQNDKAQSDPRLPATATTPSARWTEVLSWAQAHIREEA